MSEFEGSLDDVQFSSNQLIARFVAPGFDPEPMTLPVMYLELQNPIEAERTPAELLNVLQSDPDCYVSLATPQQAALTTDHGNEVVLSAHSITARFGPYEGRDYEHIAKQAYQWGLSQGDALRAHMLCIAELRGLVAQQQARVHTKAQGHEVGSTARTLYDQQLSFLGRLAAATEA